MRSIPCQGAARPRRRGFTMLELVLVIAITAIIAAVAVPRYANALANYRLQAAAQRVQADLQFLQAVARASSTSQSMVFDEKLDSYQAIGIYDPVDHPKNLYQVMLGVDPYSVDLVSADFAGARVINIDGYGQPTVGGTVVIALSGRQKIVTVDKNSGLISID